MKKICDKKIIFVDCFDTLIYRCVSVKTLELQWAIQLKRKFLELEEYSPEEILEIRKQIKYLLKDDFDEIPFSYFMEKFHEFFHLNIDKQQFVEYCQELEENIELGVQFINPDIYHTLKKYKALGKKIYLISDYHLPLSSVKKFLEYHNVSFLFQDVFVSSEVNCTKRRKGSKLFLYALQQIQCRAEDVVMIGDNYDSDYTMCKKVGIDSLYYKKKNKKIFHDSKLSNIAFNKKLLKFKLNCWKEKPFLDYSFLFSLFTKYLSEKATFDNVKTLTFLSRDGYFLKILFDAYQKLFVPKQQIIKTEYCYNSRKINEQIKKGTISDKYKNYIKSFLDNHILNIVDCGWNNSSQEIFSKSLGLPTRGYYIGTFSKNKVNVFCDRTGLIYDVSEDGETSPYYWLLRTNFTIIEQILGAPHGSLVAYESKPEFFWDKHEEYLYKTYIQKLQKQILQEVLSLAVWLKDVPQTEELQLLAKMNIQQNLLASKTSLQWMNEFSRCYYDNLSFNQNKAGNVAFRKKKQTWKEVLFFPEKRLSIIVKKQRKIKNNMHMFFYKLWAKGFIARLKILGKFKLKMKQQNVFLPKNNDQKVLLHFLKMPLSSTKEIFNKFALLPNACTYNDRNNNGFVFVSKNNATITLVAHADTVFHKNSSANILEKHGVLYSGDPEVGLGADDRAGCAICWLMRNEPVNILITSGEEKGALGSAFLKEEHPEVLKLIQKSKYVLQFDKKNGNEYKTYHIPVTKRFKEFIEKNYQFVHVCGGSGTDIVNLCSDKVCGANLSIGYYNPHTTKEYLVLSEWQNVLDKTRALLNKINNNDEK